jgi:hypothetical protein
MNHTAFRNACTPSNHTIQLSVLFAIRVVCIQALVEACSRRSTKNQDRRYESKNQNISGHCICASLIEQTLPLHKNTYFECKPGKSKCVATTLLVSEAAMAKSRQSTQFGNQIHNQLSVWI